LKTVYEKNGNAVNLLQDSDIANGTNYIKFPNGIAIVFMKKDFEGDFVAQGGEYRLVLAAPFTFPFSFVDYPTISVTTANIEDYAYCSVVGVQRGLNMITQIALGRPTAITGHIVGVQVIAIGRWK